VEASKERKGGNGYWELVGFTGASGGPLPLQPPIIDDGRKVGIGIGKGEGAHGMAVVENKAKEKNREVIQRSCPWQPANSAMLSNNGGSQWNLKNLKRG
jgi:hypothetical protein